MVYIPVLFNYTLITYNIYAGILIRKLMKLKLVRRNTMIVFVDFLFKMIMREQLYTSVHSKFLTWQDPFCQILVTYIIMIIVNKYLISHRETILSIHYNRAKVSSVWGGSSRSHIRNSISCDKWIEKAMYSHNQRNQFSCVLTIL